MKTSNKILIGFVLFAIILQTTCIVIANNYSKKHHAQINPLIPLKELVLNDDFSSLKVLGPINLTVRSSESPQVSFTSYKDSTSVNYDVHIENDTCYISPKTGKSTSNQLVTIDVKGLKSIDMAKNSTVTVKGNYPSLNVWNQGGRLNIKIDVKVNKLSLRATNHSKNFIQHNDTLSLALDRSEADLSDVSKTLDAKLTNSKLYVRKAPNQINIEKDKNSKVNLH